MRIGLYLDLAVGEAPDGSATWSDREIVVPTARIGAPPDYFNAAGQNWGLAPLSPAGLAARDFAPLRDAVEAVLRHCGALRIDHAMSLYRLFWISDGLDTSEGVYVRYPFHRHADDASPRYRRNAAPSSSARTSASCRRASAT